MVKTYVPISDQEQSTHREVIYSVLEELKLILNIPPNTKTIFIGDLEASHHPSSLIDNKESDLRLATGNYIEIIVDEHDMEGTTFQTPHDSINTVTIFNDPLSNVFVNTVYATREVVISFKYKTPSKTELEAWFNNIRTQISRNRSINLHALNFHYNVPDFILKVLELIHVYRESLEPYGQNFRGYIESGFINTSRILSNLSGSEYSFAITESQVNVQGGYDFAETPDKAERDSNSSNYTVGFSYKFTYEKPTSFLLTHPIMIHNRLLPSSLITQIPVTGKNEPLVKTPYDGYSPETKILYNIIFGRSNPLLNYIPIPVQDDVLIEHSSAGIRTIFIALCQLDLNDKRALLNLEQLGIIDLAPVVIDFIKTSEYSYIHKLHESLFNINLNIDMKKTLSTLRCNSYLDISNLTELSVRNNNRVKFSMITDLSLLSIDALNRLRRYGRLNELMTMTGIGYDNFMKFYTNRMYGNMDKKSILLSSIVTMKDQIQN